MPALFLSLPIFESLHLESILTQYTFDKQTYQCLHYFLLELQRLNATLTSPDNVHCMIRNQYCGIAARGKHKDSVVKVVLYKWNEEKTQLVVYVDSKYQGQDVLPHSEADKMFEKIKKGIF